jgi:gamma-glutamyl-gamma-aminobutyrate hydrolase PuuD
MKKIAISCRLEENAFEVRQCLDIKWVELFKELDFIPIIIPIGVDIEHFFSNIEIDGILLTGGNDLATLSDSPLSNIRDSVEFDVISFAIKSNTPLFGVCRGMQIIAHYYNSTFQSVENHVATLHKITVNSDSKIFSSLKKIKEVNSFHNFAVKKADQNFLVAAQSSDGTIEAIEHKSLPVWGQMWHLERTEPFDKYQLLIMKNFFN